MGLFPKLIQFLCGSYLEVIATLVHSKPYFSYNFTARNEKLSALDSSLNLKLSYWLTFFNFLCLIAPSSNDFMNFGLQKRVFEKLKWVFIEKSNLSIIIKYTCSLILYWYLKKYGFIICDLIPVENVSPYNICISCKLWGAITEKYFEFLNSVKTIKYRMLGSWK